VRPQLSGIEVVGDLVGRIVGWSMTRQEPRGRRDPARFGAAMSSQEVAITAASDSVSITSVFPDPPPEFAVLPRCGQDGCRRNWRRSMDTDRNRDDDDLSDLIDDGTGDIPRTDLDKDEQEAVDELEVDQTELEELGLTLDDPHQPEDQ
jgi:hypothetical protein